MNLILMCALTVFGITLSNAQSTNEKVIEETIRKFALAADTNNADELASYLDINYRVVMNRLFGSDKIAILPKDIYLEKVRNKEFGGDSRKVEIESITINNTCASAKVTFTGSKMTFVSILNLLQDADGNWKLISDMPAVK